MVTLTLPYTDMDNLIPQRSPIQMVSALVSVSAQEAVTRLEVTADNFFLRDNQLLAPGILEHIAQSAAAFLGWQHVTNHQEPQIGYIGEIRKCQVGTVYAGQTIETTVRMVLEMDNVRVFDASAYVGQTEVCSCQMKVFLKEP